MDFTALLRARRDDRPSGENLEYEPGFIELELAAQRGEERQIGNVIQPAEDPDFTEMRKLALAVLEQSHEIRGAVYLAEALLHTKGLAEFASVLGYVRAVLQDFWETCHPELDEDDGDPTMRINAVQGLASGARILSGLRRTPLTDSRVFGRITLRQIELAEGTATAAEGESVPDSGAIAAAFQDTAPEVLAERLAAVRGALADIAAIDAVFMEHVPGQGPQLDPLKEMLSRINRALGQYADVPGGGDVAAEEPAPEAAATPRASAGAPMAAAPGVIAGPDDVIKALDRIMAYYAREEPSSPVPIILGRAKRLVNADFLTIIRDMASDGLDEVKRIGGITDDDDD